MEGHPALPPPPPPAQAKARVSPSAFPLPPGPFLKGWQEGGAARGQMSLAGSQSQGCSLVGAKGGSGQQGDRKPLEHSCSFSCHHPPVKTDWGLKEAVGTFEGPGWEPRAPGRGWSVSYSSG